jgi:hypothetical protein
MELKSCVLASLAMAILAGCQTPPNGTPPNSSSPPEVTIQSPVATVRSATIKTMADRDYSVTPVGADTLLFDRTADLGSTLRMDFLEGRKAWRRVRIRLFPTGATTRITAEPSLVVNRGEPFEHEEPDNSGSAREAMQGILESIRAEAGP